MRHESMEVCAREIIICGSKDKRRMFMDCTERKLKAVDHIVNSVNKLNVMFISVDVYSKDNILELSSRLKIG